MTSATTDDRDTTAYPPAAEFAAQANASEAQYDRARSDRLEFWAEQARRLHWEQPWTQVLDWSAAPVAKWFVGGKLNVAYNCVDRHVLDGHGDQVAIHWEGEPGDSRAITYEQLRDEVCRAANALTDLGLIAGDRVAIYMPMVPEAIVSMLACARLGLTHSVVFAGFSPTALRQRVDDAGARLVITTDGQWRRGAAAPLKAGVDEALGEEPSSVEHVLVVRRTGIEVPWTEGRDLWWHDTVTPASPHHQPQPFDAEHPLFIL
ncbi:AMP-binding protein, partial [Nocardia beijingensis]